MSFLVLNQYDLRILEILMKHVRQQDLSDEEVTFVRRCFALLSPELQKSLTEVGLGHLGDIRDS